MSLSDTLTAYTCIMANPWATLFSKGWAGFLNSYDKDRSESFKEKPPVINATCLRIDEVLDLFGVRHINYLSVDTEGSELMILETFPFDRITADLVGVESLKGTEARSQLRAGIIAHMESKGYKVAHTHPIDGGADTEDLMFTPIKPWPEDKETLESNAKFDDMHRICKVLQRCLDSDAPKWNGDAGLVTEQKSA